MAQKGIRLTTDVTLNNRSLEAVAQRISSRLSTASKVDGRHIQGLSRPLGKITGQADEFTKSLAASNARVIAFGASVAVINGVSLAFKGLVEQTIKVEKVFADINVVLNAGEKDLRKFGEGIFDVAKNTAQSFDTVAEGALEFARQGLGMEESLIRINDALILTRLTGLDVSESVEGLTAAVNTFKKEGITTGEVINKLAELDIAFAVSSEDLIKGLERAGGSAGQARVSFEELAAMIAVVQERTARGGSVIGNALRTIFARLQGSEAINAVEAIGVAVLDAEGNFRSTTTVIEELSAKMLELDEITQADIIQKVAGKRQRESLIALFADMQSGASRWEEAIETVGSSAQTAYAKNTALNETLDAVIKRTGISVQQLAARLGELGLGDNLKNLIGGFNGILEKVTAFFDEEEGSKIGKAFIKGFGGAITSAPVLGLLLILVGKLVKDMASFGIVGLRSLLGLNKSAEAQKALQESILHTLINESVIRTELEKKGLTRVDQETILLKVIQQQTAEYQKLQKLAATIAPGIYRGGARGTPSGIVIPTVPTKAEGYIPPTAPTKAKGYIPNAVQEEKDNINRGVGGAKAGDKPVFISDFNYGRGKRGPVVANTGERIVENYQGSGGSAILNRDMMSASGTPDGSAPIASKGYIPNFALGFSGANDGNKPAPMAAARGQAVVGGSLNESATVASKSDTPNSSKQRGSKSAPIAAQGYIPNFASEFGGYGSRKLSDLLGMKNRAKFSSLPKKDQDNINGAIASKSKKTGVALNIDTGGRLGVVSALSKGTSTTKASINTSQLSRSEQGILKSKGLEYTKQINFTNLQVSSLDKLQTNLGKNESQFKKNIAGLYAKPTEQLSQLIFGDVFSGDERAAIQNQIQKTKLPSLFSTSVEGGIFESAVRLGVKGAKAIPDFTQNDETTPFDFEETGDASEKFKRSLGFGSNLKRADAKRTATSRAVSTLIGKSLRAGFFTKAGPDGGSKLRIASEGYIPNFASKIENAVEPKSRARGYMPNFASGIEAAIEPKARAKGYTPNFVDQDVKNVGPVAKAKGHIPNFVSQNVLGPKVKAKGYMPNFANQDTLEPMARAKGYIPNFVEQTVLGTKAKGHIPNFAEQEVLERKIEEKGYITNSKDQAILEPADKAKGYIPNFALGTNDAIEFKARARGYIPNFASGIEDAIDREKAAGVPINQIRINQSGKLRNAQNPEGLAVTNMRDEPTGRIPNFAPGDRGSPSPAIFGDIAKSVTKTSKAVTNLGESAGKTDSAMGASIGSIFALQTIAFGASEAIGGLAGEADSASARWASAMTEVTSAAISFSLIASGMGGAGGKLLGVFGGLGKAVGGLGSIFKVAIPWIGGALFAFQGVNAITKAITGKGILANFGLFEKSTRLAAEELGKLATSAGAAAEQNGYEGLVKFNEGLSASIELLKKGEKEQTPTALRSQVLEKNVGGFFGEDFAKKQIENAPLVRVGQNEKGIDKFESAFEGTSNIWTKILNAIVNSPSPVSGRPQTADISFKKQTENSKIYERAASLFNTSQEGTKKTGFEIANSLKVAGANEGELEAFANDTNKAVDAYWKKLLNAAKAEVAGLDTDRVNALIKEASKEYNDAVLSAAATPWNKYTNETVKVASLINVREFKARLETAISTAERGIQERLLFGTEPSTSTAPALTGAPSGVTDLPGLQVNAGKDGTLGIDRILATQKLTDLEQTRLGFIKQREELEANIASERLKNTAAALKEVKGNEDLVKVDEDLANSILERVAAGKDLAEVEADIFKLMRLGAEQGKLLVYDDHQRLDVLEKTADQQRRALEYQRETAELAKKQTFGAGIRDAFGDMRVETEGFSRKMGYEIPSAFRDGLVSALSEANSGAKDLKSSLIDAAQSFLNMIQQAFMRNAVNNLLGAFGSTGVGQNLGFTGMASGGFVKGGSGVRDDVPAMLTGGEYIIRKTAVKKYGVDYLESLNKGAPQMATGGRFSAIGYNGQGEIRGIEDLKKFATTNITSGATDKIASSGGISSIDLEDFSSKLTGFGRTRGSPMQDLIREQQMQALGLIEQEDEYNRKQKEQKKAALKQTIIGTMLGIGLSYSTGKLNSFMQGVKADKIKSQGNILGEYDPPKIDVGSNREPFTRTAAEGGRASSGGRAMLMGGEFRVGPKAVKQYGEGFFDRINNMSAPAPRYQMGGPTGSSNTQMGGGSTGDTNITITVNKDGGSQTSANGQQNNQDMQLANKIQKEVVRVIENEKRPGGTLSNRHRGV